MKSDLRNVLLAGTAIIAVLGVGVFSFEKRGVQSVPALMNSTSGGAGSREVGGQVNTPVSDTPVLQKTPPIPAPAVQPNAQGTIGTSVGKATASPSRTTGTPPPTVTTVPTTTTPQTTTVKPTRTSSAS